MYFLSHLYSRDIPSHCQSDGDAGSPNPLGIPGDAGRDSGSGENTLVPPGAIMHNCWTPIHTPGGT